MRREGRVKRRKIGEKGGLGGGDKGGLEGGR